MKYAAAVGSAGYPHFTDLNVQALRWVFGKEVPVVITDDASIDSPAVEAVAGRLDCYYKRSDVPLGHFAGDVQTFLNALSLAGVVEADVAIKLSQRAIVAHPDLRALVERSFLADPNLAMILAGRPNPNYIRQGHQQFARFPILTDIVFMRAAAIDPEELKRLYEAQVHTGKAYHDCFVEVFIDKIRNTMLKDRVLLMPEITDHRGGRPPFFLRRYQNRVDEYARLASRFGITRTGTWELGERAQLQRAYNPRPQI